MPDDAGRSRTVGKRKVKPEVKRAAAARVVSGSSSLREEASRTGLSKSTLHEAVRDLQPKPGEDPGQPQISPGDSALEAAQKAVGAAPPAKGPLTPEEILKAGPAAREQDENYCVTTLNEIKTVGVFGGGLLMGIPVLTEKRLLEISKLGEMAEGATRTAAPELAPLLRKWLPEGSTLAGLVVVLLIDLAGTWSAMREIALEYRKKREAEEAAKKKEAADARPAAA
jgi:hypothetical protein